VAALAIAAAGAAAFIGVRILHPTISPSLRAVSNERLSEGGILLLNPFPWDHPDIGEAQAGQLALQQAPVGSVLQTVLAEVIQTGTDDKRPRLCWVVSLPASGITSHGPAGSIHRTATYYVVLIDARTGEFISGQAGG
jgi:hypothetical protein